MQGAKERERERNCDMEDEKMNTKNRYYIK